MALTAVFTKTTNCSSVQSYPSYAHRTIWPLRHIAKPHSAVCTEQKMYLCIEVTLWIPSLRNEKRQVTRSSPSIPVMIFQAHQKAPQPPLHIRKPLVINEAAQYPQSPLLPTSLRNF